MVDAADFSRLIIDNLHYQPTGQQVALIDALSRFCNSPQGPDNEVFLLNGYAGTGKTSVVGAMVKALAAVGRRSVLLAPTGRAAKVFSRFAGHPAYTRYTVAYIILIRTPESSTLLPKTQPVPVLYSLSTRLR